MIIIIILDASENFKLNQQLLKDLIQDMCEVKWEYYLKDNAQMCSIQN